MNITLSLALVRPEHLRGRRNNFLLITELVKLLDGVCALVNAGVGYDSNTYLLVEFDRPDDPMDEPITDQDDALNWALSKLVRDMPWAIEDVRVDSFEPDQPPLTKKEIEADRNLGDRPFGG